MQKPRIFIVISTLLLTLSFTAIAQDAKIGDKAAPLKVSKWIKGGPVDLAASEGKRVHLVEFWATWCPACRESIPHLSEIARQYKDRGLVVVGISDEDVETLNGFVAKQGERMAYAVGADDEQATVRGYMAAFNVDSIPAAFLIDQNGDVVWVGHPQDGELVEHLNKLLPKENKGSAAKPAQPKKSESRGSGSK